jgi:hypothetical protein
MVPLAPSPKPTLPPPPSPPPAVDHVFEIEGNAVDESPTPEDWNTTNPSDGQSHNGPIAGSAATNATFVADIVGDTFFTGGSSKDFQDIEGNWLITTTSVPDKDEIDHAYAATFNDNTGVACTSPGVPAGCNPQFGHKVLVFGGDRHANNGDANIGFWFFQGAVAVDLPNSRFTGFHKNGDLFIVSAFTQGGGTSTVDVYEWVGTPDPLNPTQTNLDRCNTLGGVLDTSGDDTICKVTSAGKATGIVNPAQIFLDWPYTPKGGATCNNDPADCPAAAGAFYEGGIDLTELNLGAECFASFLLETRSSQSVDAVLKDFALGNFESCSGTCNKSVSANTCLGGSITLTYESSNTGGTALGQTFKDVNDNGTPATGDDTTRYITGGLSVVPTSGPWTPTDCTFGAQTTINVPANTTLRCTSTETPSAAGTFKDVLTVHTVLPFENAVAECTKDATVTIYPNPSATAADLTLCETTPGGGTASFDLTAANSTVTGGASGVSVSYFSDAALTSPISSPYVASNGTVVYAKVTNDTTGCSNSAAVTLHVNPSPAANTASITLCETTTGGGTASFNLTSVNNTVTGGAAGVTVTWFSNAGLTTAIATPAAFVSGSATVYARVSNNTTSCFNSAAVTLTVEANPSVSIAGDEACSTDETLVLTATVTGGSGTITYSWSFNGVPIANSNTQSIDATAPGNYSVHVTRGTQSCPADAHLHVGLCAGASTAGP